MNKLYQSFNQRGNDARGKGAHGYATYFQFAFAMLLSIMIQQSVVEALTGASNLMDSCRSNKTNYLPEGIRAVLKICDHSRLALTIEFL